MTNRLNITLSASIDSGEGAPTARSQEVLDNLVYNQGSLWALDVLGDWEWDIKQARIKAEVAQMGWACSINPNNYVDPHDFAATLWAEYNITDAERAYELADIYSSFASPEDCEDDDFLTSLVTYADEVAHIVADPEEFERVCTQRLQADIVKCADAVVKFVVKGQDEADTTDWAYEKRLHTSVALAVATLLQARPEGDD